MTLIRAMDKYRRPPTSPIASLRGKCFPGDPILTMEPPGTTVRIAVFPGRT